MQSCFSLSLDTTGPVLNIIAPSYVSRDDTTYITIESNEKLMDYQDVYFIDSQGLRRGNTFEYEINKFSAFVTFAQHPIGISTLYVQLKDESGNISDMYTKSINIVDGLSVKIYSTEVIMTTMTDEPNMNIYLDESFTQILDKVEVKQ